MLMRFDPFQELSRAVSGTRHVPASMPMDAYRDGDTVHVRMDIPGVRKEDLELTVEKSMLTISAERRWEPSDDVQLLAGERTHGRFERTMHLGEGLDLDSIVADYEDGVLHMRIPVAETAKPRKVEIGRKAIAA